MRCLFRIAIIACGVVVVGTGCSMGPQGFLDDYATVGGKWQRNDPTYGRVGSIFSDPGTNNGEAYPADEYVDGDYTEETYYPPSNEDGIYDDVYDDVYGDDAYYDDSGETIIEPNAQPEGDVYQDSSIGTGESSEGVIILSDEW